MRRKQGDRDVCLLKSRGEDGSPRQSLFFIIIVVGRGLFRLFCQDLWPFKFGPNIYSLAKVQKTDLFIWGRDCAKTLSRSSFCTPKSDSLSFRTKIKKLSSKKWVCFYHTKISGLKKQEEKTRIMARKNIGTKPIWGALHHCRVWKESMMQIWPLHNCKIYGCQVWRRSLPFAAFGATHLTLPTL
jgi:hypothetical protein